MNVEGLHEMHDARRQLGYQSQAADQVHKYRDGQIQRLPKDSPGVQGTVRQPEIHRGVRQRSSKGKKY